MEKAVSCDCGWHRHGTEEDVAEAYIQHMAEAHGKEISRQAAASRISQATVTASLSHTPTSGIGAIAHRSSHMRHFQAAAAAGSAASPHFLSLDLHAFLLELAEKVAAAVPKVTPNDQKAAVTLYRLLSAGKPVAVSELAATISLPEDTIRAILERWPVFYDDAGSVIGFGGLTIAEMPPHRFEVDGRTLYAWCAWDALFLPGVLGKTAHVQSIAAVTKQKISLVVDPDGIRSVDPPEVVVSFLTPDRPFDQNVIVNFCHFLHFFASAEAGRKWVAEHPGTLLLSLDEAFILGQLANDRNFGDALAV